MFSHLRVHVVYLCMSVWSLVLFSYGTIPKYNCTLSTTHRCEDVTTKFFILGFQKCLTIVSGSVFSVDLTTKTNNKTYLKPGKFKWCQL